MLFDDDGNVSGMIDWELAALGPGELDLAWWMMFDELFSEGFHVPRLEGLPDRDRMIAIYEDAAGRKVGDMKYYDVLTRLRMSIVTMRAFDRIVAQGRYKADNDAWSKNPFSNAVARLLEGDETARGIEAFSRRSVAHGGEEWTSEDVRPGSGLRLYRATADSHWILARDGQPDHRIPVPLS